MFQTAACTLFLTQEFGFAPSFLENIEFVAELFGSEMVEAGLNIAFGFNGNSIGMLKHAYIEVAIFLRRDGGKSQFLRHKLM